MEPTLAELIEAADAADQAEQDLIEQQKDARAARVAADLAVVAKLRDSYPVASLYRTEFGTWVVRPVPNHAGRAFSRESITDEPAPEPEPAPDA